MGCSVFLFAMACGAKNTILLHAPAFILASLLLLGRAAMRPRLILTSAFFGLFGLLVSGVAWSYAQNQLWFGDWRGHPYLKETLAKSYDIKSMWTRVIRAFVTVAYDCGWLPGSLQPTYAHLATATVKALGGEPSLAEDTEFYSFNPKVIRVGAGMGPVGPAVVIPSLIIAAVLLFRRNRLPSPADSDRYRALTVFALASFVACYVILRTQTIGVARLTLPCVAVAMPLSVTILRTRIGRWIGLCAAAFSLLLSCLHAGAFAMYRLNVQSFPALTNLKRTPSAEAQVRWSDEPSLPFTIREPYTDRELYGAISKQLHDAKVVGLIGGYITEGYFCFGPDFANRVISLRDCRSDTIKKPGPEIDCIVVEDFDAQQIDSSILQGYRRVFEAFHNNKPTFVCYVRESEGM
jgi:hypothetical protein